VISARRSLFDFRIRQCGHRVSIWRPTALRLRSLLRSVFVSYVALGVTLYILRGPRGPGPIPVLALAASVAAVGVVLRPLLAGFAALLGRFGALAFGFISQTVILDVAVDVAPSTGVHGLGEIILVSWVTAAFAAIVNWALDAGSEDDFQADLLYRAVRVAHRRPSNGLVKPDRAGLLILQLDGVGEDLLRQAMSAGTAPTLANWLRSESHVLRRWHTGLPATTPAGQSVILHGNETEIPAFRWWEKETGRLLVVNHPPDATEIQHRLSDGHGLLAEGGVSVSNLFSGDAPTTLLTMSDAELPSHSSGYRSFVTDGTGLVRSVVVAGGQVITELYQGRRQRHHHVEPRVRRGLVFALQRAVTTALLRDLSVAPVTDQIARAAPVIYVDFTDYDEVAHHAGPSRVESMRALEGLDRLVGFFANVVRAAGCQYEIVVLSDHGQAQGATFRQRSGMTLHDLVESLTEGQRAAGEQGVSGDRRPAERWSSVNLVLGGVARSRALTTRAIRALMRVGTRRAESSESSTSTSHSAAAGNQAPVVAASGSLAHVYLPELPGRAVRDVIESRYPDLIAGLAAHPDIGAVIFRTSVAGSLVALGAHGWRAVSPEGSTGGEGIDPLAPYGPQAADDVRSLDGRRHVGDIVVLGAFDPGTGEVAAFEELVGSHGGLGGAQTEALLLHPATWSVPSSPLNGLALHQLLRAHLVPTGTEEML
jgi:hypothetical protein